jgi:MFS family permease
MNDIPPAPVPETPPKLLNESETITPVHRRILTLSWAGWVFDFYDLILFTFLMMPISEEYHFTNMQMSFVLGATLAATAAGGVIFGVLADRFGRKAVLQWTILTYSIGTFLSGLAGHFWVLMVFRILTGLGVGGEWGTGQTFI